MRVVHVASEVAPFAQSGGLADVVAGLPTALATLHGLDVGVVVPLYHGVEAKLAAAGHVLDDGHPVVITLGVHRFDAMLRLVRIGRVAFGFLDCAALYDRPGTLYGPGGAGEFPDNHIRFGALGKAALEHGHVLVGGPIDVLHVHDWQGAPAAIYARVAAAPVAIVTTIHNLAYRGIFAKQAMYDLGLPWSMFHMHDLEFYDQLCLLKGGLAAADAVTTVSPTYAREILTPERGEALDAFLRWDVRRLVGITNGIDLAAWDPATDVALPARYSAATLAADARQAAATRAAAAAKRTLAQPIATDGPTRTLAHRTIATPPTTAAPTLVALAGGTPSSGAARAAAADVESVANAAHPISGGKQICRAHLAAEFGLELAHDEPLIGVIARMTGQKGLDLVADIVPELHRLRAKLIVLGSGEPELEARFLYLADSFRDHLAVRIGFDLALSRRIYAGCDLFAMPSRFEPCGLGQLYSMRYGTVPIVHAVGGLRDTVIDPGDAELSRARGTGIRFESPTAAAFTQALERAIALYRDPDAFAAVRQAAMQRDSSWIASAQQFVQLYRSLKL